MREDWQGSDWVDMGHDDGFGGFGLEGEKKKNLVKYGGLYRVRPCHPDPKHKS